MKLKFSSTLTGKSWWKPFLGLFAAWLAALILFELSWMRFFDKGTFVETLLNIGISLCAAFPLLVLSGFCAFFAYSRIIKTLSLGDSKFGFRGSLYAFSGDFVKGCLLTLISGGLYLPALLRQTHAYLLHATEFKGHRLSFRGKAKSLYRIFALWLIIPILGFVGLLTLIAHTLAIKPPQWISPSVIPMLYAVCTVLFITALGPFLFFYVSWCCDFKVGTHRISLETQPDQASKVIALQLALSAITLGLYVPVAILRIWDFLAKKTIVSDGTAKTGSIGFTGNTLRGYTLLLGNALLCVITFGVWTPWGIASITHFLTHNTFVTSEK